MEFDNMLILEEYRGKRIGTQLANALIEHCKNIGINNFVASPNIKNQASIALWKKLGLKELEIRLKGKL